MARQPGRRPQKKLIEAAEFWLTGGQQKKGADKAEQDAEAFGVVIVRPAAAEEEDQAPEQFEVWPENATAVEWFLRLQTQWRVGMGGAVGIDYGVAMQLFSLYQVAEPRPLLEDLQTMEFAVLDKIAEQRRAEG